MRLGREWDVVLVVLGLVGLLIVLAMLEWWLGLLGLVGCLAGLALALWWDD